MKNLTQIQRKFILKSKILWSSHTKWSYLPVATISIPEALDIFQRDIWYQNPVWYQNPLSYIKSNKWLINWIFYFIDNFKAKQISQWHLSGLNPANLNFTVWNCSQAFRLSNFDEISNQNKTFAKPFSKLQFRIPLVFLKSTLNFASFLLKIKVVKK